MKKLLILLLILCFGIPAYSKQKPEEAIITPMTQLQKRQYQTRTYNSTDKVIVMKSLLNAFQDEGYIVYNVNSLLGFIYGVKDFDTSDPNIDISKEFGFTNSRLTYNGVKVATVETTANITEYGENIRVRVNFKRKLLNQYGNAQFINDIEDSSFYEKFYEKVDNAMNLYKQANNSVTESTEPEKPISEIKKEPNQKVTQKEENTVKEQKETEQKQIQEINTDNSTQNEEITEPAQENTEEEMTSAEENNNPTEEEASTELENEQEEVLSEKELKKLEKQKLKEQLKIQKEEEKQAKQEAKILKELDKIQQ